MHEAMFKTFFIRSSRSLYSANLSVVLFHLVPESPVLSGALLVVQMCEKCRISRYQRHTAANNSLVKRCFHET